MRKFHPFFAIGTVGMIVLAFLHVFLALGLALSLSHSIFFALYSTFLGFLILGVTLTVKKQKAIE